MIILDENIPDDERILLSSWRIRVRHIGFNLGRSGMLDDEIVTFLQQQKRCTFFTNDIDYYHRRLRHPNYALIYLAIDKNESAFVTIQPLLQHYNGFKKATDFFTRPRKLLEKQNNFLGKTTESADFLNPL